MLIFGFGPGRSKDLGPVARAVCPSCRNEVFFHHVRSKKAFRLYFVPVVPYGTDDYLLCPICSNGMQLTEAEVTAAESMKEPTAQFQHGRIGEVDYAEHLTRFWQQLGIVEPGATAPAPVPSPVTPVVSVAQPPGLAPEDQPPPDDRTWVDKLADLERLRAEGILDDDQFESARRRLLGE